MITLSLLSKELLSAIRSEEAMHHNSTQAPHALAKFNHELSFQVKLHAFLLWASFGCLMPVGMLVIRVSNRVQCGRRMKILFYSHVVSEIAAVLLAAVAAVFSIKKFDNSFGNNHQRMGLGLYGLMLAQPLLGFFRPIRGVKVRRSIWYTVHWLLGTAIVIAGIINIYFGLRAYEKKALKSLRIWELVFTAQLVCIALVYLFQGRWKYIKNQGVILGEEQISPADIQMISAPKQRDLKHFPCVP